MKPLVSVVIPTFNRAADLRRAMTSVVNQTFADWEMVIVDNHSTDDTLRVVESFSDPRVRLVEIHNDGIIARSRNRGIASAAGEFVALLDSDDWWTRHKLALSVAALQRGADVVYHDLYRARWPARWLCWRRASTRPVSIPVYEDLLRKGNALNNSSVVARRDILMRVQGFSEDAAIIGWEDFDGWLRIARMTDRFVRLDRPLGYYWIGGGNTSSPARLIRNIEQFRERYLAREPQWSGGIWPPWCHYSLGLAYYELGCHSVALDHLRSALRARLPVSWRLKALVIAALSSGRALTAARVRTRRTG
jgi:glycosyltransferase involved in cell wall biosynthesis